MESERQMIEVALGVKAAGADMLRGGAFKPRTSPHDFQGLGLEGLKILRAASDLTGLPVVTEVLDVRLVELVSQYADMLQIGSRSMQNYPLLVEAGRSGKPVLLKRGMAASLCEWLGAAEYIANEGNLNIVLCERGIKTHTSRRVLALRPRSQRRSRGARGDIPSGDRGPKSCNRRGLQGRAGKPRSH